MMSALNEGEFKCENLSFEEARAIIDVHDETDMLRCFSNNDIETVIFDYLIHMLPVPCAPKIK
ncbi:MAG TPA: hypothetical protein IAD32_07045 [Candidatus Scatavimonas merdigallinarum]|uniref:Uncharacterized protein n=1 Tax=Candidatus Scatavimonas merdigallinarum TaxID=2840914 RepID=A0A9D0ZIR7_9FIRM|nr:hypothetical protein [Candidatus Scatavimonas merdigallinarum]